MDAQISLFDAKHDVGGQHIDMVFLRWLAVHHRMHGQPGIAPDDLVQQALACWTEMRDDHEGHAGLFGQAAEKTFERLDTTRRGADADNRKSCRLLIVGSFRRKAGTGAQSAISWLHRCPAWDSWRRDGLRIANNPTLIQAPVGWRVGGFCAEPQANQGAGSLIHLIISIPRARVG